MTSTKLTGVDIVGGGWSGHFNKVIAYDMYENIKAVGMPEYSEADQQLARGIQRELGQTPRGLGGGRGGRGGGGGGGGTGELPAPPLPSSFQGGGSDDIGDVSWNVPTVTLRFPGNIPGLPGHNWANAISMATPIAHKGIQYGARVVAMTVLDLLNRPELVQQAWDYFNNVQTKNKKYIPLIRPEDKPAIWLNQTMMEKYRPEMKKYYYDPSKYKSYLEQLGIKYPTVKPASSSQPQGK
jgi:aminobenzoyl-glutamate utilization protein B